MSKKHFNFYMQIKNIICQWHNFCSFARKTIGNEFEITFEKWSITFKEILHSAKAAQISSSYFVYIILNRCCEKFVNIAVGGSTNVVVPKNTSDPY